MNHRSPIGGFLGVIVGVALVGCGADDADDGTSQGSTASMSTTDDTGSTSIDPSTTMTTEESATGSETLTTSASEATGPLYGPVTDTSGSESDTDGTSSSSGTDGTDGTDDSGSTDASGSGDSTSAESESAGPLYGPVTNGG